MQLKYRVASTIAAGSLLASIFAPSALANGDIEISGNGKDSNNSVVVTSSSNCSVKQKNYTTVELEIASVANSGGNKANSNTGGDVSIDTGKATSEVTVGVTGGSNEATDPCCCQEAIPAQDVTIKGNGDKTTNTAVVTSSKSSKVKQKNSTFLGAAILSKAKSGKNKSNSNTGGSVGITTDDAKSTVDVTVDAPSNTLN